MKENCQLVKKAVKLQRVKWLRKGIWISRKEEANQVFISGLDGVTESVVRKARTSHFQLVGNEAFPR
jgi:hypothetical protein